MTTGVRVLAVATLVAGCMGMGAPPRAHAIAPPAVDDTFLPPPGLPSPPQRTRQQEQCSATTFDISPGSTGFELNGYDLDTVWRLTTGQGQTVAVIDTGVAPHPRLPRVVPGGDYVSDGDGRQDCDGHGTLVAGIISAAADPAEPGFVGVAPGVSLIAIRQSSTKYGPADGGGSGYGDVDTLAKAVRTAADMGATVINISSVACVLAEAGLDDRALGAALAYAVDAKDAVVVAAAGNVGGQCPQQNPTPDPPGATQPDWEATTVAVSPGWYDDYVLTVGSVSPTGSPSEFSLAGPWVDLAAPGEAVLATSSSEPAVANTLHVDGEPKVGTSYAAPVVSGVAALVRARFPHLSARQVMNRIEATARHPAGGWNPLVGSGVVDPLAAVSEDPPLPDNVADGPSQRPIEPPESPRPPDSSGRATAFTGLASCVAALAALLGLVVPANRLARRRPGRSPADDHTAGARKQDVMCD